MTLEAILTFPVVWDTIPRIFAQREMDPERYDAIMSRMIALRDRAQTHHWGDVAKRMRQREEGVTSGDARPETDEESSA